jgi:hypothetical protein
MMEDRDDGRTAAFQAVQDMLDLWVAPAKLNQLFRTDGEVPI